MVASFCSILSLQFQSTLPLRGATTDECRVPGARLFQSTLPLRGATFQQRPRAADKRISIHAPLAGSDGGDGAGSRPHEISIHAPLAGSDGFARALVVNLCDFNPRSPCGERPSVLVDLVDLRLFQSTLPLRGATRASWRTGTSTSYFNPRSPCGERLYLSGIRNSGGSFQSTLPLRGATVMTLLGLGE